MKIKGTNKTEKTKIVLGHCVNSEYIMYNISFNLCISRFGQKKSELPI